MAVSHKKKPDREWERERELQEFAFTGRALARGKITGGTPSTTPYDHVL
jgi:hypothetical protein